jgi:hypothetical protein
MTLYKLWVQVTLKSEPVRKKLMIPNVLNGRAQKKSPGHQQGLSFRGRWIRDR